jgi:hypothetical protein
MRFLGGVLFIAAAIAVSACGSRTELGEPEEEDLDSSVPDDASEQDGTTSDVTVPDVTVDVPIIVDVIVVDVPVEDVSVDVEPPPIDAGPPPTSCPSDCTRNHECESMCTPTLAHGRYCCDEPTGMCYAIPGHHCPVSIVDAGFD